MLILSKHGGQMPQTFARKDLCETAFSLRIQHTSEPFLQTLQEHGARKICSITIRMDCKGIYHIICNSGNAEKILSMYQICSGECMHQGVNQQMPMKREDFSSKDSWRRGFSSTFSGHSVAPKDFGAIETCCCVRCMSCGMSWNLGENQKSLKDIDFDLVWFALFRLRGRYTYQDIWWSLACQLYCIWSSKGNACCSYCQHLPRGKVVFPQAESQALAIISHIAVPAFLYMHTFDSSVLIDTTTILTKERKRRETADGHSHGFLQSASFWPSTRGARELCFFVSLSQGPSKMVILNTGSVQSRSALGSTTGILSHPVCKTWEFCKIDECNAAWADCEMQFLACSPNFVCKKTLAPFLICASRGKTIWPSMLLCLLCCCQGIGKWRAHCEGQVWNS